METLPVEILHRIFDNLDVQTILFSVRSLSRLFQSVVSTYDRFSLDLRLMSKSHFNVCYRLIKPQNVISLMLSNDERTSDAIDLFIENVRFLRHMTRLRSLSLFEIDESQLDFILKRINLHLLTSFTFSIRKSDDRRIKTTNNLLGLAVGQSNLQKLNFGIISSRMTKVLWPSSCTFRYLTINKSILMVDLLKILQCSSHVQTLVINEISIEKVNNVGTICFPQLRSLTMDKISGTIDGIQSFLLSTPGLIYLKLIGNGKLLDGKRWEEFIQINLVQLDKFEFFFHEWSLVNRTLTDLELIINSFQTSFWIEHKKWFVTGEFISDYPSAIDVYSIPICKSSLQYELNSKKISLSNLDMTSVDESIIINSVESLALTLDKSIADDLEEKKITTTHPLFPQVNEINIDFDHSMIKTPFSLQSFSTIVDIVQLVQIKLCSYYFDDFQGDLLNDIRIFLNQAHNLSSLTIQRNSYGFNSRQSFDNICSIIPCHIKHLEVSINTTDQISRILGKCQHLWTIKFRFRRAKFSKDILQWFEDNTVQSSCSTGRKSVAIWLGKINIQTTDHSVETKRTKVN